MYNNDTFPADAPVGGVVMMENTLLKLKFRVIALVSNENDPNSKAKALFKKFKENNVKDYLNKNSLNQAGYEVEIENFDTMDSADVDEYFYAFDKADWESKGLFTSNHPKKEKVINIRYDDKGNPSENISYNDKIVDVVAYEGDIDGKTATYYFDKLKSKSKSYIGGLIILADYESKAEQVGAFSQTLPLDHNLLFVYSTNSEGLTYAHEIGHMLGLIHTFIRESNKQNFLDKKNQINNFKIKNINPIAKIDKDEKDNVNTNKNYDSIKKKLKPLGQQNRTSIPFNKPFDIVAKTLINCINNTNLYYSAQISDYTLKINSVNNQTNYTIPKKDSENNWIKDNTGKLIQFQTNPNGFKSFLEEQKNEFVNKKNKNIETKDKLERISNSKIFEFNSQYYLLAEDCLKIYKDYLDNLNKEWLQIISNYLYFKENSTKNILDYTSPKYEGSKTINQRILFSKYQILIIRKDYENNK